MTNRTFKRFIRDVKGLLGGTAGRKGYARGGPNGFNRLYEFVQEMNRGQQHALGEIVYKTKRYAAKGNPEDVLKIAAWAFLVWRHHQSRGRRRR